MKENHNRDLKTQSRGPKEGKLDVAKTIWFAFMIVFAMGSLFVSAKFLAGGNGGKLPDIRGGAILKVDNRVVHLEDDKAKLKVGNHLKTNYDLDEPAKVIEKTSTKNLSSIKGKYKVILTVPSLDTPVCSMQTAALNMLAPTYKDTSFVVISQDLPFAQSRYCGAKGIDNVNVLSDYRNRDFSKDNGLLVRESQLNARSIVVVDNNDKVVYVEYANEQTKELNLQKALDSIK